MKFRIILLLSILLACTMPAHATHIVGGELNYRCLGNNQYEISLTVYRDCFNGVPYFDNPAVIGIFDNNNVLVDTIRMPVTNDDTLVVNLNDPCLVVPPNICYHKTTYRAIRTLPFLQGGYQLAYQRCCRNNTINNIPNPGAVGATYYTFISEEALLTCNSNPVFRYWPEPLICNNVPINFDHVAFDYDGDSIVYEMCTPFDGATPGNPMPQPPFNPPYDPISWLAPYSLNDMLGGVPLSINPQTGLLTGTPNTVGQFVVGVCAKEYRNGNLISITRRDFQYNVGICGELNNAAFFTPTVLCDSNLTAVFYNQSQSQVPLPTYFWNFGDPTTAADTSNSFQPSYVYPDTGQYTVTLIVGRGSFCADTFVNQVIIRRPTLDVDFSYSRGPCADSVSIAFTDLSVDNVHGINSWLWVFGNGDSANVQNPTIQFGQTGNFDVTLYVASSNGCVDSLTIPIELYLPFINSGDTVAICPGTTSTTLNPGGDPGLTYQWSPSTNLSASNVASPIASPSNSTLYTVTATAYGSEDTCILIKDILVAVPPPIGLAIDPDTIVCSNNLVLAATTVQPAEIDWFVNNGGVFIIGEGYSLPIFVTQDTAVYLVAIDEFGCFEVQLVNIDYQPAPITVNFDYTVSSCEDSLVVQFQDLTNNQTGIPVSSWQWNFGNGQTSSVQSPSTAYTVSGTYPVSLQVTLLDGCSSVFNGTVNYLAPVIPNLADTLYICLGDSINLAPGASTSLQYNWLPNSNISNANSANPLVFPSQNTLYQVQVQSINGQDTCLGNQGVQVMVRPRPLVQAQALADSCAGPRQISVTGAGLSNYQVWYNGQVLALSVAPDFSIQVANSGAYIVQAQDQFGCFNADTLQLNNRNPVLEGNSYTTLCGGDTLSISANVLSQNGALTWNWQPATDLLAPTNQQTVLCVPTDDRVYRIIATDAQGCADTAYSQVSLIGSSPALSLSISRDTIYQGDTVQLTATNAASYTYSWSPSLDNIYNPIARPETSTTYTLSITDADGCSNSASIPVVVLRFVCDEPFIFIPNAFTPNADGANDQLFARSSVLTSMYFAVYNRWGELVFETTDPDVGWDGTFRGEALPPDSYGYYFRGVCLNGQPYFKKGNVSLIR